MSKIATLEVDGQKIELPVITGSENESAIDRSEEHTSELQSQR